jgi:predicted transcriptional regulator
MSKERVRVSPEIRAKAVGEIKGGKSRQEVADELGVSLAAVHLWMSKVSQESAQANKHDPTSSFPRMPISELEKRVKLLELENEYLKQRLAILEG